MRLSLFLAALVVSAGCHANNGIGSAGSGGSGETTGSGGSATGGATGNGGASGTGGAGSGGKNANGGATGSGGATGNGGATATGGTTGSGGAGTGGTSGAAGGGTGTGGTGPGSYALNPPKQCDNQFFVQGCTKGMTGSACGGVCAAANACEDISQKPGADVGFLCPRFALQSSEMLQAATDDFGASAPFNYAIVGHDVDQNGLDGSARSACCQCYQLVYDLPEAEAQVQGGGTSAIAIPKPLIVQAFNTSAGGGQNFDVYMAAGGFGAFNACDPSFSMKSPSGLYLYSQFPEQGEANAGGVNAATQLAGCKDNNNLVSTTTLSSTTCQANIETACNTFASTTLTATAVSDSIQSCKGSNDPANYTHINWLVYAKRIECPTHLTEVTGCKLAPQGLPAANPNVTTPGEAAADSSFKALTGNGLHYTTTTMQDCCKPTCAWQDWVTGQNGGLTAVGQYNSFYSCDQHGVPVTE
ncbi:MAG TPA: hypothetical protein VGP64_11750 [Polyangia bacterium]|jgi:hypothetical protein